VTGEQKDYAVCWGLAGQSSNRDKENVKFRENFTKSDVQAVFANAKQKAFVVAHTIASEVGLKSKRD
jgi:hypothetical protein